MAHSQDVVLVDHLGDSGVTVVTLNRPVQRNAINQSMADRLAEVFRDLEKDSSVSTVVLTGSGKAFCAGIDLSSPVNALDACSTVPSNILRNPVKAIEDFHGPVIGAINGPAVTGGFEIALACDFLVGGTTTTFRDTHCLVGVVPCWGLSQKLSRLVGPGRARMASLTASKIKAETALSWGLLADLVDGCEKQVLDRAIELATMPASFSNQDVLSKYKRTLVDGFALSQGDGLALEHRRASAQYASLGQQRIAGGASEALRAKL